MVAASKTAVCALMAPPPGRAAVEKIGPCGPEVGDGVEDQRTSGIKDRLVVIAVELPAAEASAGRQTTGGIGRILG